MNSARDFFLLLSEHYGEFDSIRQLALTFSERQKVESIDILKCIIYDIELVQKCKHEKYRENEHSRTCNNCGKKSLYTEIDSCDDAWMFTHRWSDWR